MAKFAAVAQNTQHAPGMASVEHHTEMVQYANDMVEQNKPLEFFCRNTQEAVVSSSLKEAVFYCREAIKKYLDEVQCQGLIDEQKEEDDQVYRLNGQTLQKPSKTSTVPRIIVAGGDAEILQKLLTTENNHLLEPNPDIRPYTVAVFKHLMAFGIANALKAKIEKHKETPISQFDKLLLGCRVAKEFKQPDEDGDRVYRGTIAASVRNRNGELQQYLILYDDVDTEEMSLVEIHGTLIGACEQFDAFFLI